MTEEIGEQILAIRDTGLTNMFDTRAVKDIAKAMGFYELLLYIVANKSDYVKFIMYGDD